MLNSEKLSEIEIDPEDAVYEPFQNLSDDSDSVDEFQLWLRQVFELMLWTRSLIGRYTSRLDLITSLLKWFSINLKPLLRQKIDNVIANGYPRDEVENFFKKNLEKLETTRPNTAEIIKMILVKRRKKESDNIAKTLIAMRSELRNPEYDKNKS